MRGFITPTTTHPPHPPHSPHSPHPPHPPHKSRPPRFVSAMAPDTLFGEKLVAEMVVRKSPTNTSRDAVLELHARIKIGLYKRNILPVTIYHHIRSRFIQPRNSSLCQLFAVFQLLYTGLWTHLDVWTQTMLLAILQSELPSNTLYIGSRELKARPAIMDMYIEDPSDRQDIKEASRAIRIQKAVASMKRNPNQDAELLRLQGDKESLRDGFQQGFDILPWNGSFTRILRAMLRAMDGPNNNVTHTELKYTNKDMNIPRVKQGFTIVTTAGDQGKKGFSNWQIAIDVAEQYHDRKGYCIRAGLKDANHFIVNVKGTWYDPANENDIIDYKQLSHYKNSAVITEVTVIMASAVEQTLPSTPQGPLTPLSELKDRYPVLGSTLEPRNLGWGRLSNHEILGGTNQ